MAIQKLDIIRDSENCVDAFGDTHYVSGNKVIKKLNELVDVVNEIKQYLDWDEISGAENCECAKNAHEPITLTDVFNEMGRLYADLWNKMEDIPHELRKEQQ